MTYLINAVSVSLYIEDKHHTKYTFAIENSNLSLMVQNRMGTKLTFSSLVLLFIVCVTTCYAKEDSPDVRFVKEIVKEIWANRQDIVDTVLDNYEATEQAVDTDELQGILQNAEAEERVACGLCTVRKPELMIG